MKVGFNMLVCATLVGREHLPELKIVQKAGADGVEIPVMEGDTAHYVELGKMLDDIGLLRTSAMAILDQAHNPLSDDKKIRQAAVDNMRIIIDRAAALGATVICGPMYQVIGHFSGTGPTETEKKRVADMLRAVAGYAGSAGIKLAIEPINRFEAYVANTQAAGADLVKRVGKSNVGLHYDTFHANIEEKDPIGAIRKYGKIINHFHVSANDRGTPGQDHIDWKATFSALHAIRYDGWIVVEAFGDALPGLAAATRIWRKLFKSNEQLIKDSISFVRKQWTATN